MLAIVTTFGMIMHSQLEQAKLKCISLYFEEITQEVNDRTSLTKTCSKTQMVGGILSDLTCNF
jgi:hypothetical protein